MQAGAVALENHPLALGMLDRDAWRAANDHRASIRVGLAACSCSNQPFQHKKKFLSEHDLSSSQFVRPNIPREPSKLVPGEILCVYLAS